MRIHVHSDIEHVRRGIVQRSVPAYVLIQNTFMRASMFRPDPNGPHSVADVITRLADTMRELPPDSPRAEELAEMIRRLRGEAAAKSRKFARS